MSDIEDKIAKLVAEAERRGSDKALRYIFDLVSVMLDDPEFKLPTTNFNFEIKPKRAERGTMSLVLDAITKQPGLRGVELHRWLEARGTPVEERTVRTNLRRLRQDRLVMQRDKRWYPKSANLPEGEDTTVDLPF